MSGPIGYHFANLAVLIVLSIFFLGLLVMLWKSFRGVGGTNVVIVLPSMKIMMTFIVVCYACTTYMVCVSEMYAVAEIRDHGGHAYLDHEVTIALQVLSVCTFIIAQLSMLWFFIFRLQKTFAYSMDTETPYYSSNIKNAYCIYFLKIYFVLFVMLLCVLPAIYFVQNREITELIRSLLLVWFFAYILLMLILVVLFLYRTKNMLGYEFEYFMEKMHSHASAAEQDVMLNSNQVQLSIKYGLLTVVPLISTMILLTLSLAITFVVPDSNTSTLQTIDGYINSLCILLLLHSNQGWYERICFRCHACHQRCCFQNLFANKDLPEMQKATFTELVIR